ncbi:DNA polymerase IV [Novipirellula aureliae]|uniref:DNA polymerase IV n=1 Tax=Novipirellula aureliae TaxID=2527966 RepID=A0A5C6DNI4_9BACT|nr:DNA polymerase IV [Novipirellula aureliae]TWU36516.1 DNA polymerase IV [Novipirellula aureliae]
MILHVDMDAFYASVEERERPELVGRPVVVGGTPEGRGVVAAANYAARKFGVHSAIATATALRLCPGLTVLPVRMSYYAEVSRQIRDIFFRYTPLVEPLSLDEAFLDVTGCESLFGKAEEIAFRIKQEIKQETSLVASVGVAPNKFLAKIASDLQKPDGLVVVRPDEIQSFLDPLPVGRLWGVGKVTGGILDQLGIHTIEQLRGLSVETLRQNFGSQGEHFWKLSRGIDDRAVVPDREAKSISHETTFATDIVEKDLLLARLSDLTEQVMRRLRCQKKQARTVHLKIRLSNFRMITRSRTLPNPTDVTAEVWQAGKEMLNNALSSSHLHLRLVGVGVSNLSDGSEPRWVQQTFFDEDDQERQEHAKQRKLDSVTDAVRDKFGSTSLSRGNSRLQSRTADRKD